MNAMDMMLWYCLHRLNVSAVGNFIKAYGRTTVSSLIVGEEKRRGKTSKMSRCNDDDELHLLRKSICFMTSFLTESLLISFYSFR